MIPQDERQPDGEARPQTYPLGERDAPAEVEQALALLAPSHTSVEHRVYLAMLAEVTAARTSMGAFSTRRLMALTRIKSSHLIRRGLAGLRGKMSVELQRVAGDGLRAERAPLYLVFGPEEIFARRVAAGLAPDRRHADSPAQALSTESLSRRYHLSGREAEVARHCAEGMTNAEIARQLSIRLPTVKFHMTNIFVKFGVKRRTELVALLFTQAFEQGEAEGV